MQNFSSKTTKKRKICFSVQFLRFLIYLKMICWNFLKFPSKSPSYGKKEFLVRRELYFWNFGQCALKITKNGGRRKQKHQFLQIIEIKIQIIPDKWGPLIAGDRLKIKLSQKNKNRIKTGKSDKVPLPLLKKVYMCCFIWIPRLRLDSFSFVFEVSLININ